MGWPPLRKVKRMSVKTIKTVIAVDKSQNSKTGPVSCTYAPIHSCPKTCPFLNSGCYAQHGHSGIHLRRMNRVAETQKRTRPIDIARAEAKAIRNLKGQGPLRLHVVGDCKTSRAAKVVSMAAEAYMKQHDQKAWTYTHAWKEIPRESWGDVSVLASCETLEDAKYAMERGYAACMVRYKEFNRPFSYKGIDMIPCLQETKGIKCDKCKICMHDDKLRDNKKVICFFPHGSGKEDAKRALFK
jgi:hypothetical protein